jgi:hypothetical protein
MCEVIRYNHALYYGITHDPTLQQEYVKLREFYEQYKRECEAWEQRDRRRLILELYLGTIMQYMDSRDLCTIAAGVSTDWGRMAMQSSYWENLSIRSFNVDPRMIKFSINNSSETNYNAKEVYKVNHSRSARKLLGRSMKKIPLVVERSSFAPSSFYNNSGALTGSIV